MKTISRRHVHAVKKVHEASSRRVAPRRAAVRSGKSGTGCRDTDLTNHKGYIRTRIHTYIHIMATYSSIQGRVANKGGN